MTTSANVPIGKRIVIAMLPLLIAACSTRDAAETRTIETEKRIAESEIVLRNDWKKYFDELGVHGTFALYDLKRNRYEIYNRARFDSAYLPASTFKIPNAMIALETGVIKDVDEVIPWDSVERAYESWNQDQTLRTGMRHSTVWAFQEIARRIGEKRMREYLKKIGYGNADVDGGIDLFWLDGDLRITPRQQIEFLVKFHRNELPFSRRTMDMVREITILEETDEYVLRGKTGWAARTEKQHGWIVGYVERGEEVYFYALNIDIVDEEDVGARMAAMYTILASLGLVDPVE